MSPASRSLVSLLAGTLLFGAASRTWAGRPTFTRVSNIVPFNRPLAVGGIAYARPRGRSMR